jgi:hypothetical protein
MEKRIDPKELSLVTLIRLQNFARASKDAAEEVATAWGKIYDYISIRVTPERMTDDGITNIKVDQIGRVELRPDIWTQTLDPVKLKGWLEEQGMGDIIVPSVNGSTLKALIREQMKKDGGSVPPADVVQVTPYTRAVIVKG